MSLQLIFLGAPGSGKGTQAEKIVSEYGYKQLSTGDLLRSEMAKGSDLGKRVEDTMKSGGLVDDATVLELLKVNCDLAGNKYIFDGYPRNIDQAKALQDQILKDATYRALYLDVSPDTLVERLTARRVCPNCKAVYNVVSLKPKEEGICDKCGTGIIQREDDKEEVIRNRMDIFLSTITPVLNFYKEKGVLETIDASIDMKTTNSAIKAAIDKN